jgi:hypothetical protein
MNLDDSTKCIRKSDGTFEFRAEDFPPLWCTANVRHNVDA